MKNWVLYWAGRVYAAAFLLRHGKLPPRLMPRIVFPAGTEIKNILAFNLVVEVQGPTTVQHSIFQNACLHCIGSDLTIKIGRAHV